MKRVGLLATAGTIKARVYHDVLDECGIEIITLDDPTEAELVMKSIYAIKADRMDEAGRDLVKAAEILISQGAEGVIAGCTEIPLVLTQSNVSVPLIDPASVLAQAAVKAVKCADG